MIKNALIITGGYINLEEVKNLRLDASIILAADSGYTAAKQLNIVPDIILGDFDSLKEEINTSAEIIRVPAEKDDTDTMLACNIAIDRGASELLILGGTGGRADHFLANVFFLEAITDNNVKVVLTDGENTVRILKDETVRIAKKGGYFSIFALDNCTVSLSGCKYPLENRILERTNPFAVSNEVTDNFATVTVTGKAILCESKNG